MKNRTTLLIILVVAIAAFLGGYLISGARGKSPSAGGRKVLYYVDPMHPAYKSDKPGIAPDCGMQLEPVYADGAPATGTDATLPPGAVRITSESRQLIGVRTATVQKAPLSHTVRVLGRVAPDENRVFRINASIQGFVHSISPVTTGSFVARDQYLASIYSPELYSIINSYIFSLNAIDRQNKLTPEMIKTIRKDVNIRNQRNSLLNIGMSETQLNDIERERYNKEVIDIRATEPGFVLNRNISLGERFDRGAEFYRIADLSKVWILADLFENEVAYFAPGARCTVRLPGRNLTFPARVGTVLPLFDPATRTMKVRLEVDNTGMVLRPDMYVDVELPVTLPATMAVPREAVLDSGLKQTVFVDRGNGVFEPRPVQTGRNVGDQVEILNGLVPGEKIVVSGNFLLDSETRLRNATAGISGTPGRDPVCGMALDEERARAAGLTRQFGGKSWYFCSPEDMAKFDKAPQRYTGPNAVVEPMPKDHNGEASKPMAHPPAKGAAPAPMTPMAMPAPAGKSGRDARSWMNDADGHRRNIPEPMDEPGRKDETMEEEAPPRPLPAPPPPPPSFSSIKVKPVVPPADTPAPATNSSKVPPAHDK